MLKGKKALLLIVSILLIPILAQAGPVPDTGQTKCYDDIGEITCPQSGEPFHGQDANYTINPPSYTKLDAHGNDLPIEATEWAMVRDNVTGMIWEVKTDGGSIYDKDNQYTYGNSTEDFLNVLNAENFGGFSDWRLPTLKELRSLVNYGRDNPTISTDYFSNAVSSDYWSSTTDLKSGGLWRVNFHDGSGSNGTSSCYVRAVRGGQSGSVDHFIINGNGTVTDTDTGLMWQQDTATNTMDWRSALSYCEALDLGGYNDWRLPNIKELSSIADLNRYDPAIETDYFPDTVLANYWSSTTYASRTNRTWLLNFHNGLATKTISHLAIMCVLFVGDSLIQIQTP